MSTLLVKVKEMFSFRQGDELSVHVIADSCQHLKKLSLDGMGHPDAEVIYVIKKIGKQLTTLCLDGGLLTDVAYLYLNNCAR